ncbi:MAG: DoxX family protein [Halobacteriovoraceae bacterium]|nr:DoxX family protein [Halobacteriovoraceae bacterium]
MTQDLACLVARLTFGATMFIAHGLPKLMSFSQKMNVFPDPLGVGSSLSLGLTIFAEVICAGLVAFGVFTRFVSIPLGITMLVAMLLVHGGDPWQKKEMAFLYLCGYIITGLLGSGRFSLDFLIRKKV